MFLEILPYSLVILFPQELSKGSQVNLLLRLKWIMI